MVFIRQIASSVIDKMVNNHNLDVSAMKHRELESVLFDTFSYVSKLEVLDIKILRDQAELAIDKMVNNHGLDVSAMFQRNFSKLIYDSMYLHIYFCHSSNEYQY